MDCPTVSQKMNQDKSRKMCIWFDDMCGSVVNLSVVSIGREQKLDVGGLIEKNRDSRNQNMQALLWIEGEKAEGSKSQNVINMLTGIHHYINKCWLNVNEWINIWYKGVLYFHRKATSSLIMALSN